MALFLFPMLLVVSPLGARAILSYGDTTLYVFVIAILIWVVRSAKPIPRLNTQHQQATQHNSSSVLVRTCTPVHDNADVLVSLKLINAALQLIWLCCYGNPVCHEQTDAGSSCCVAAAGTHTTTVTVVL